MAPPIGVRRRLTWHTALAVTAMLILGACRSGPAAPAPWPAQASLSDSLTVLLEHARADSVFPGGIVVIGTHDRVLATVPVGTLDWAPSATVTDSTLWDIASLTKLVALTTAIATLVDDGRLTLDDTVRRWVPEWRVPGSEGITICDLLLHRSGLPAFKLFYKQAMGRDTVRALVLATPLDTMPRARMVYSDLGAIILGIVVERVTGQPFDVAVRERVFTPLGLAMRSSIRAPRSSRALRPRSAIRGAVGSCTARCTTKTLSPWVASRRTRGCSPAHATSCVLRRAGWARGAWAIAW